LPSFGPATGAAAVAAPHAAAVMGGSTLSFGDFDLGDGEYSNDDLISTKVQDGGS
jgi:hypothetical protein